jgi:hypothetical protein
VHADKLPSCTDGDAVGEPSRALLALGGALRVPPPASLGVAVTQKLAPPLRGGDGEALRLPAAPPAVGEPLPVPPLTTDEDTQGVGEKEARTVDGEAVADGGEVGVAPGEGVALKECAIVADSRADAEEPREALSSGVSVPTASVADTGAEGGGDAEGFTETLLIALAVNEGASGEGVAEGESPGEALLPQTPEEGELLREGANAVAVRAPLADAVPPLAQAAALPVGHTVLEDETEPPPDRLGSAAEPEEEAHTERPPVRVPLGAPLREKEAVPLSVAAPELEPPPPPAVRVAQKDNDALDEGAPLSLAGADAGTDGEAEAVPPGALRLALPLALPGSSPDEGEALPLSHAVATSRVGDEAGEGVSRPERGPLPLGDAVPAVPSGDEVPPALALPLPEGSAPVEEGETECVWETRGEGEEGGEREFDADASDERDSEGAPEALRERGGDTVPPKDPEKDALEVSEPLATPGVVVKRIEVEPSMEGCAVLLPPTTPGEGEPEGVPDAPPVALREATGVPQGSGVPLPLPHALSAALRENGGDVEGGAVAASLPVTRPTLGERQGEALPRVSVGDSAPVPEAPPVAPEVAVPCKDPDTPTEVETAAVSDGTPEAGGVTLIELLPRPLALPLPLALPPTRLAVGAADCVRVTVGVAQAVPPAGALAEELPVETPVRAGEGVRAPEALPQSVALGRPVAVPAAPAKVAVPAGVPLQGGELLKETDAEGLPLWERVGAPGVPVSRLESVPVGSGVPLRLVEGEPLVVGSPLRDAPPLLCEALGEPLPDKGGEPLGRALEAADGDAGAEVAPEAEAAPLGETVGESAALAREVEVSEGAREEVPAIDSGALVTVCVGQPLLLAEARMDRVGEGSPEEEALRRGEAVGSGEGEPFPLALALPVPLRSALSEAVGEPLPVEEALRDAEWVTFADCEEKPLREAVGLPEPASDGEGEAVPVPSPAAAEPEGAAELLVLTVKEAIWETEGGDVSVAAAEGETHADGEGVLDPVGVGKEVPVGDCEVPAEAVVGAEVEAVGEFDAVPSRAAAPVPDAQAVVLGERDAGGEGEAPSEALTVCVARTVGVTQLLADALAVPPRRKEAEAEAQGEALPLPLPPPRPLAELSAVALGEGGGEADAGGEGVALVLTLPPPATGCEAESAEVEEAHSVGTPDAEAVSVPQGEPENGGEALPHAVPVPLPLRAPLGEEEPLPPGVELPPARDAVAHKVPPPEEPDGEGVAPALPLPRKEPLADAVRVTAGESDSCAVGVRAPVDVALPLSDARPLAVPQGEADAELPSPLPVAQGVEVAQSVGKGDALAQEEVLPLAVPAPVDEAEGEPLPVRAPVAEALSEDAGLAERPGLPLWLLVAPPGSEGEAVPVPPPSTPTPPRVPDGGALGVSIAEALPPS